MLPDRLSPFPLVATNLKIYLVTEAQLESLEVYALGGKVPLVTGIIRQQLVSPKLMDAAIQDEAIQVLLKEKDAPSQ